MCFKQILVYNAYYAIHTMQCQPYNSRKITIFSRFSRFMLESLDIEVLTLSIDRAGLGLKAGRKNVQ